MHDQANPNHELQRLFRVEYGDRREVIVRILSPVAGAGLLYGYTAWISAWVWVIGFVISHAAYFFFLTRRMTRAKPQDEVWASLLFLVLLASFLWMPAVMICANDRALSICGAALVGCILVFLVRRSDSTPLMIYGEILVVAAVIIAVFWALIPQFDDPFAKLGLLACGMALLYYFAKAASVARQMRLEAAEANQRSMQAEKMAAIGRLAGGVAHDFNNNLTAIMGHLELLAAVDNPQDRRESIEEATLAARQATRTVKQLLAFARKEKMALTQQNGAEILDGLVALTRRLLPVSVRIKVQLGPEPQEFLADRAQLLSALINLVVNAVDAMPEGGDILLSSQALRLDLALELADGGRIEPGPYVRIAVQDTGAGIRPQDMSKVLEPFFTTKPVGKGTGLGLPMAFGVSRELGGGLTIDSGPTGTRVAIYLPQA